MKTYQSLTLGAIMSLLLLAGCVTGQLVPTTSAPGQAVPETVPLGMDEIPPDALEVIGAYVARMRGVPAGKIEQVRFAPALANAIEQSNFHFGGFQLAAVRLFLYENDTADPYKIQLGALLTFMDPIGRRTAMAMYAVYGVSNGRLQVTHGAVEGIFPDRPQVELYLLRSADMPNPIPVNNAEFYRMVLAKALSPEQRARSFGRPQPYTLVAFAMDRLEPKAKLQLRVSDDPKGVKGYAGGVQEYNFAGWHVSVMNGIFTLDRRQPMFAKVVYTPGSGTSLFLRQPRLAALFDLRQTSSRKIEVRSRPPLTPKALKGRPLVRSIQQELNALGYQAGPADGLAGKKTRQAIRAFQKQAGVRVDGQPSVELLELLRQVRGR